MHAINQKASISGYVIIPLVIAAYLTSVLCARCFRVTWFEPLGHTSLRIISQSNLVSLTTMWKLSKCGDGAGFLVLEGAAFFSSSFFLHLLLIRFCLTYMKFHVVLQSTGYLSSLTCLLLQLLIVKLRVQLHVQHMRKCDRHIITLKQNVSTLTFIYSSEHCLFFSCQQRQLHIDS